MAELMPSRCELILGGQKSGKSSRAEWLARNWLEQSAQHRAVMLVTGTAWDVEMQQRIARHQLERALRVPGMVTVEAPLSMAQALQQQSRVDTLVVVDCLTLWLTNWLMPMQGEPKSAPVDALCDALSQLPGPVILVSNEIGFGVIPMGAQVRAFVDALGLLNQRVAQMCDRVTLMAAGFPLTLKGK